MGELERVYGVKYQFSASDNVTNVVGNIERSVNKLDASVRAAGSDIDNTFKQAQSGLESFSSKLQEVSSLSNDFLSTPSQDSFTNAYDKAKEAVESYESELKTLVELQKQVEEEGGDTSAIQDAISKLTKEYGTLNDTMAILMTRRFTGLAEAFNDTADAAEKDKIMLEAVNDLMKTMGLSSEEATSFFESFLKKIEGGGNAFNIFKEALKGGQKEVKGFKDVASDVVEEFVGKGGLKNAFEAAAKAFSGGGGFVKAIGAGAKALGSGLVKAATAATGAIGALAVTIGSAVLGIAIKKIASAVKEANDFKRSLREGLSTASLDAASEVRKLDELNTKLMTAKKGSAEYNKARAEIISNYGKYNQHLDQEIKKVGDLSTTYDQLRSAIVQASIAKQRDILIEETEDRYGSKLADDNLKMLKKYQRKFGAVRGQAAFQSWSSYVNFGTEMSEDAKWGADKGAARAYQRKSQRMNRDLDRVNAMYNVVETDNTLDYTAVQQQVAYEREKVATLRGLKQQEVEMEREQDQLMINAMADGAAKQRAQAELDFKRRVDQLEEQARQYVELQESIRKAEYEAMNGEGTFDPNSPANKKSRESDERIANQMRSETEELYKKMLRQQLADIAYQQRQSLISSYGTLAQQKEGMKARWGREGITAEFRDRANAIHEYEFAQMDYEAIQKYGSQGEIREALEKMLDAEIKTLEDAERPAAEARKRVTLAEFDAELAEKYASRGDQRKALEEKLDAELQTIDEKYREIQAAANKVTLAEFDKETVDQYGTRSEKRGALENLLNARLEEYVKRNGEAQRAIIEAQNEFELANFDYEEVVDYGSYDKVLDALRKKWQAYIATLSEDWEKEGATKKMNEEIYALEREHEGVYQRIFGDIGNMSNEMISATIELAEQELQHLIATGDVSADKLKDLRDQIDKMKETRDEMEFGGWGGGSITDVLRTFMRRERNRENRGNIIDAMNAEARINGSMTDEYKRLQIELEAADDAEKKLTQDIQKQAAVIVASNIGGLLSEIGSTLAEIAQVSGNTDLSKFGQDMAEFGQSLSNVANGFAQGGLVGGIVAAAKEMVNSITSVVKSMVMGPKMWQKAMEDFSETLDKMKYTLDATKYGNIFGSDAAGFAQDAYAKATLALNDYRNASEELRKTMFKTQEDTKNPWWLKVIPLTSTWSWFQSFFGKNKHQMAFGDLDIWGDDGFLDVNKAKAFLEVQTTLTEEQVEQINNIIAMKEAYDDAVAAVEDYVASLTGSTASNLAQEMLENFIATGDAVLDLTDDMDSFAQAIAKSAIEAELLEKVFNDVNKKQLVDLIVSGNNAGAIDFYNQLLDQANELAPKMNDFLRGIGINVAEETTSDSSRSSKRSSLGASQDSIDESNGRLTAIQGHTYSIMDNVSAIRMQNEELRLRTTELLAEVMGIHTDTTHANEVLEDMAAQIKQVREGVNTIVDKGVTML